MSEAASRNRRNRAAGKSWERQIETDFRALSLDTERTRDSGEHDQGDLVVRVGGKYHVLEAKNVSKVNMTDFVRQAELERDNFAAKRGLPSTAAFGAALVKRKGKTSALDGFVLMSGREYVRLIKANVS